LCTALALIGNSNIILLDEPTSGMDQISKKALWEFLKSYQRDKIILITTHYLEEAEYLGDRIGIMSDGKFICCGTSSFLKSKYPCGFNINLLVNSNKFTEEKKIKFLKIFRVMSQISTLDLLLNVFFHLIYNQVMNIFLKSLNLLRNQKKFMILKIIQ
jgi:ATP-binding cassette subfamily A (ABC1) protein 3